MQYTVEPGLYALGNPDPEAVVLVTANYKMSFDVLRSALPGVRAWILVLDTRGINVWCAAGKGTFSTEELVSRIHDSGLEKIVSHRTVLLPQLGAPGMAAHRVKSLSGFKALFGPIRAIDIPLFLESGWKTTPEMRQKQFPLQERAALIPIELVAALKYLGMSLPAFWLLEGLLGPNTFWSNLFLGTWTPAAALTGAVLSGTILTPLLLPWLPGRAFSVKGSLAGGLFCVLFLKYAFPALGSAALRMEAVAWIFLILALSAFLGMNFTGASTYTSLSGVKKEMQWAVPFQIGAAGVGILLWIGSKWTV